VVLDRRTHESSPLTFSISEGAQGPGALTPEPDDRVEVMKFDTSIMGGKAPGEGTALSITLGFQSGDALAQVLHARHPTAHLATGENTHFDLSHVEQGFHA
jgi:hypothetical protein